MEKFTLLTPVKMISGFSLSGTDIKTLTLLYQPLIGSQSVMLYLTILNLLDRQVGFKELYARTLADLLNCNITQLNGFKDKLEGIGLLKTYQKDESYLLCLNPPMTAKDFLTSGILGEFLHRSLGDLEFNALVENFHLKQIDRKNYQEVTKTFDQVFEIEENLDSPKIKGFIAGKKQNKSLIVQYSGFDYQAFLNMLPKKPLKSNLKSFEKQIIEVAYLYSLNQDELAKIIKPYLEAEINFKDLAADARNFYEAKMLKTKDQAQANTIFDTIKNLNMRDLLFHQIGREPLIQELEMIKNLVRTNLISEETINFLILFVLKKKDNTLQSYKYLEIVAKDWQAKGITSAESAHEYLMSEYDVKKTNRQATKKKTEEAPWLKEFMKNL
ncbi:MAG: DnaD domain protein [Erysipelotrichales bacterium]|nr:DnaD domain protein [Erysipelotrichales bacterium]